GGFDESVEELFFGRLPFDIDIASRSGAFRKSRSSAKPPFSSQRWRGCVETGEESVEREPPSGCARGVHCHRRRACGVAARALAETPRRRGTSRCAFRKETVDKALYAGGTGR